MKFVLDINAQCVFLNKLYLHDCFRKHSELPDVGTFSRREFDNSIREIRDRLRYDLIDILQSGGCESAISAIDVAEVC